MLPHIAILGASGFVGSRLVEVMHLDQLATLRPIVRSYSSLARLSRFDLDWRIADACDQKALAEAFSGCDMVVNLIAADPSVIVASAKASYLAAQAAGVKRMVYMSSASVHGQAPALGTDEASLLHTNHPLAYNNAKVLAERALLRLRERLSVELSILRPGIVYGPRSRWIFDIADQILSNSAYLINDGEGICNSIYVDNLIEAIGLALEVPAADREVFLVGDRERVTWSDFYRQIASGLGFDLSGVVRVEPPIFKHGYQEKLNTLRTSKNIQKLLSFVPSNLKQATKGAITAANAQDRPSPWLLPVNSTLDITEEFTALHQCSVQLPWIKAQRILGYQASLSFDVGMQRSIGWLNFAGYPVHL